ncbi:MAG TPA: PilZ domain-containing protein [Pyrinomonadaceae bacterium]|nr:PilZ domain-containing protein [Pyrinomonadaceae bacterium]
MARHISPEQRTGPRYLASLLVRAEWDTDEGKHVVAEGTTENVGPEGALVHLQRELPDVGSRVQLLVLNEEGQRLQVVTEVLRLERNAAHPLAALQLLDATEEWRGLVWEPAAPRVTQPEPEDDDDALEELDEETTH